MKAFSFYLLLAVVSLSVQATLLKGLKPDFILILVCYYSLKYGQMRGMAYGAFTGFLIDSASGFIFGPNILTKSLAGFFMYSVRQKLFQWNIIITMLMIGIFSLADIFLVYICFETFLGISLANKPFRALVMQAVYTMMFSAVLYPLLKPEEDDELSL